MYDKYDTVKEIRKNINNIKQIFIVKKKGGNLKTIVK